MTKKKVGGKSKSEDVSSEKDKRSKSTEGSTSEDDEEKTNSGGSKRVLRPRKAAKGDGNADEKAKGKKPMAEKGNLRIHDGAEKGDSEGARKVTAEENAEMPRTPAKRKRNAGKNEKEKSISSSTSMVLRSHSAQQRGRIADEKAKGKGKLVAEEENLEKSNTPAKRKRNDGESEKGKTPLSSSSRVSRSQKAREGGKLVDEKAKGKRKVAGDKGNSEKAKVPAKGRNTGKEIAESSMSSDNKSAYNLRARKGGPSFQRVRLSESGFSLVVGKRVKVFRSSFKKWVTGKIESYDDTKGFHKVFYDDGELVELDLNTHRFEVDVMPGEASTLSFNRKPDTGKKPMHSDGVSGDAAEKNTKLGKEKTSTVHRKNPTRKGRSNAGTEK